MTKDIKRRKTTMEERIMIVEYCISHSNNYTSAAKEFNCSYGQVYSWVKISMSMTKEYSGYAGKKYGIM